MWSTITTTIRPAAEAAAVLAADKLNDTGNKMWGVSLGVGTISLLAAVIIATVGRMIWPRTVVALVITGVAGLLAGSFGPWLHGRITMLDDWAAPKVGQFTGLSVSVILALAVFGPWAFWLYHGQIDLRTLGFSAAIPLTVTFIPGLVGTVAVFLTGIVPWVVSGVVGLAFFQTWGG